MKSLAAILIIAAVFILCAANFGIVGFHYPMVIQDEPLRNPQKVVRMEGTNIFLQNGAVIEIESSDAAEISNKLHQSAFNIDIEGTKGEPLAIFARQDGWICGTPWVQPIRIPLIRDNVYKNRRKLIAIGSYVESNGQPAFANSSQLIRSETNPAQPAVGSHR